jgi:hypothetical protein
MNARYRMRVAGCKEFNGKPVNDFYKKTGGTESRIGPPRECKVRRDSFK